MFYFLSLLQLVRHLNETPVLVSVSFCSIFLFAAIFFSCSVFELCVAVGIRSKATCRTLEQMSPKNTLNKLSLTKDICLISNQNNLITLKIRHNQALSS